jgi:ketosteroid isomerase-like protein
MSQQNLDIVRAGFEHFIATGDPAWDTLDEHVEVHDHDLMDVDDYHGVAGYAQWLADWAQVWSDFSIALEDVIDAGASVVVVFRLKATGRSSGVTVQRQDAMVCAMRDGKTTRIDYFNNLTDALAHAGVSR